MLRRAQALVVPLILSSLVDVESALRHRSRARRQAEDQLARSPAQTAYA
jgi:hypothetical protein